MPKVVNMHDAKSSLSRLAKRAAAGEDIVIARNGKPMAMLTRVPVRRRSTPLGTFKGKIHMAKDFDAIPPGFEPYL
ncbi:MAG TPA: type II toxin-antitoxin system Phd/YefM family antitoxin [Bryobacteraceae bacterium]|jgi:antitoxin (DNA-binding transcriptional repressor) of toxin-antitoxin stability system|nr:type II toxin-antitoxin system Phd/YefM family antitoxin [Bryobacteraceae bacterium]